MSPITMKQLLEAGMHFGHQVHRWHPKMQKYIFGTRNGIHIIDLQRTLKLLREAHQAVRECVAQGGVVLFVGTKKQAQQVILDEAKRCNMFSVTNRWVGGTLTNFATIRKNLAKLHDYEQMEADGLLSQLPRKEVASLRRKWDKLKEAFSGIQELTRVPDMIFIIDLKKEHIAIREAARLGIPTVAIVDTNCDPGEVTLAIPGNDDAIRSIKLVTAFITDAVTEGQQELTARGGAQVTGETEAPSKASEAELAEQVAAAARALRIEAEEEGTEEDLKLFEQAIRGDFRADSAKEGRPEGEPVAQAAGAGPQPAADAADASAAQPAPQEATSSESPDASSQPPKSAE